MEALERAAAIEPGNFETAYALGEVLRQQSFAGLEGYQELARRAMTWFEKTIKLNPHFPYPHSGYGMCLDWLGRTKEGEASFQRARELDPNGARTLAYLGWHYFQLKDYETSRRWLERSLSLNQDEKINPMALPYLRLVDAKLGEDRSGAPLK